MAGTPAFTSRTASLLITVAAALILIAVFAFQHLGGAAPCPLCIWQRYPWAALVVLGALGFFWRPQPALVLCALVLLVSAGLAGWHYGIEAGWFALPETCAAAGEAASIEELRQLLREAPPSCDQVRFTVFGQSLAAWNLLASLGLAGFAGYAAARR